MAIKLLIGFGLAGLLAMACGGQEVDRYYEELAAVDLATDAIETWTLLVERDARVDTSTISRSQALAMVRAQLVAAQDAYETSNEAIDALMQATPPEQCKEAHIVVLEALQLTERAFLELKNWLESGLRGGPAKEDARIRGNQLLNEADLVKQRGLSVVLDCN